MTHSPRANTLARTATLAILLTAATAWGQLRVASWNVSNYNGGSTSDIQTAVYGEYSGRSFSPDIILGQEFYGSSACSQFNSALNSAAGSPGDWDYVYAPGDPGEEGSVLFYRTSKINYLSYWMASPSSYPSGPRPVYCFKVRLQGYSTNLANLYMYNLHMKAGSSGDNKARRLAEAQNIRDNAETALPAGYHFLIAGDLNIQSSSESAYQEFVGSQVNNNGRVFDPINRPGSWNNNSAYDTVHTQDPWSAMDDRYDQILVNDDLIDGIGFEYIGNRAFPYSSSTWNDPNHSHRCWGNDGTSYNQPLRTSGNSMVGPTIAQALRNLATSAGGHLPVYLDLQVPAIASGTPAEIDFGYVSTGDTAETTISIANIADDALWGIDGISDLEISFLTSPDFSAPAGTWTASVGQDPLEFTIAMDTTTPGIKAGVLTIQFAGGAEASRTIQLTGNVDGPGPCIGDCNCDGDINWRDIDYFVAGMNNNQIAWYDLFLPGEPSCPFSNLDVNEDGFVNWRDIDPLVAVMNTPCP